MADNYLQFSEVVANLTEQEEAWLKDQLNPSACSGRRNTPKTPCPPNWPTRMRIGPAFVSCVTSRTTMPNGMRWASSSTSMTIPITAVVTVGPALVVVRGHLGRR